MTSYRKFLAGLAASGALVAGLALAADVGPDVGPKADVAAVRTTQKHKMPATIYAIHVSGNYALLSWYDEHSSGTEVYKRVTGEQWKTIAGGGGAMPQSLLIQSGVPASVAKQLCSGWPQGQTPC
jgi:hypothetical protein